MTATSQPAGLGQYLTRHGFAPNPGNPAWLDHDTEQQTVRILHEPGEATLLYCLTPRGVCQYEAVFSPGTPDAVLTAAIDAALRTPPPQSVRPRPGRPRAGGAHGRESGAPR
jgi:hypothetical protein